MYAAVCASFGKDTQVLFDPRDGNQCTIATATLELGAEAVLRKGNPRKEGGIVCATLFPFLISIEPDLGGTMRRLLHAIC